MLKGTGNNVVKAAKAIKESLEEYGNAEPEYSLRDAEIRDGLWSTMDRMESFTKSYFSPFNCNIRAGDLKNIFGEMSPETIKVIGCVASGGPGGVDGWHDLFLEGQKRRALINAIIGNVLVEQIFQHVFFGGDENQQASVKRIQDENRRKDGFDRNTLYAEYIRAELQAKKATEVAGPTLVLPPCFDAHVKGVVAGIYAHLSPLVNKIISVSPFPAVQISRQIQKDLYMIVAAAGMLSLLMRADPHTVYYFVPSFKEDSFTRKHMECFNSNTMKVTNPHERKTWPDGTTDAEKSRASGDEALTQITIMDGVTAYRRGGWETGDSKPGKVNYVHPNGRDTGIRCRVLTHGWVFCRWGRPRKFKDGKPADNPKVHGAAWKGDGFIEFRNVPGVGEKQRLRDASPAAVVAEPSGTGTTPGSS
ncbi:hypothetical protein K505DRAFT_237589 [Melanomma pulvis-pyrius CBS 109.77]|uniref:Uncharacterized protein n=1 Tax=Melanomma pulvis-pyrius CBS 109.77 TaxID=1314802 RepID=A0A6A6XLT8_9PLEO|nr:hypothetical protein K505DRAFT_237589 [Melanomma pulvis-pyrius CBS 109.77]